MVLAHQGGWDEIAMVAVPVVLFAFLLWLANRRARSQQAGRAAARAESGDGPDDESGSQTGAG